jgi:hypothetical protein
MTLPWMRPESAVHQAIAVAAEGQNLSGLGTEPAARGQRRLHRRHIRNPFLTTSVLFMGLVIALGAIGVANGLWAKTLSVSGTVVTGDLNTGWGTITTAGGGTGTGSCSYVSGTGSQTAFVAITGATIGYQCSITGAVNNVGNVPFQVIGAYMYFTGCTPPSAVVCNSDGLDQVGTCSLVNPNVNPSGSGSVACTVHVKPTALPGWTYYFGIGVCVAQWNEDPSPSSAPLDDFNACKSSPQHEGPGTPSPPAPQPPP